jgi:protein TonB
MVTIGNSVETRTWTPKFAVASLLLHVCVLGVLVHRRATWIAPMRMPGTEHGTNLVLEYLPGRAPMQTAIQEAKAKPQQTASTTPPPLPAIRYKDTTPSPNTKSPASEHPDSVVGENALGTGNIKIALQSFFPPPKPDLSALPRGTKGDVILDVVIDTTGKISDIKMTTGLGHGIDEAVIATVQNWTFHPATKDGQPVASEQELHFHYET